MARTMPILERTLSRPRPPCTNLGRWRDNENGFISSLDMCELLQYLLNNMVLISM